MTTPSSKSATGRSRASVKDKVRPVVPTSVVIPNAGFVRRDKFKRLSFELTEAQYDDLIAKAEALLPTATTIPVLYDDFKNKRVIRGKPIKESGVVVDDDESVLPVIDDDHRMEEGATYKLRGALKAARLGDPPTPVVYFAISTIDLVAPAPEPTETEPSSPPPKKKEVLPKLKAQRDTTATTTVKSAFKTVKKAKPAPPPVTVEDDDDDSGSDEDDGMSQRT